MTSGEPVESTGEAAGDGAAGNGAKQAAWRPKRAGTPCAARRIKPPVARERAPRRAACRRGACVGNEQHAHERPQQPRLRGLERDDKHAHAPAGSGARVSVLLTERGGVGGDLCALRGAAVNIAEARELMRELVKLGGGARAPERVADDDRDGADGIDARAPRQRRAC